MVGEDFFCYGQSLVFQDLEVFYGLADSLGGKVGGDLMVVEEFCEFLGLMGHGRSPFGVFIYYFGCFVVFVVLLIFEVGFSDFIII